MKKQQFKIKPATSGLTVLDPETKQPLKKTGETKEKTEYWLRRILDGDVVEIKTEKQE